VAILTCLFLSNYSFALNKELFKSPQYSIDFYSTKFEKDSSYEALIKIDMKKEWRMFAKNPDDKDLTPYIFLGNTQNIHDFIANWPDPKLDKNQGIYLFEKEVIIPVSITPKYNISPSVLNMDLNIIICNKICLNKVHSFSVELPVKDNDKFSRRIIEKHISAKGDKLLYVLLLSLIGGFILNFMPCVLPVISLKILSVVKTKGTSNARTHFIVTSLGVISCFVLIGAIIASFKATGHYLGLGFNFQHPIFVITITLLLVFFAASISDLISIDIPEQWKSWLVNHSKGRQLISSFASGVFATILATPCTAPMLGVAMSMALSLSAFEIFLSFFSMGIGLSFPFIVFAISPKSINLIPAPGPWTIKLKKILAVLLYLTVIWLIWIIYAQLGFYPAIALFLSCLLLKFFVSMQVKLRYYVKILLIVATIAVSYIVPLKTSVLEEKIDRRIEGVWHEFTESKLNESISSGKVVVVDITAEWCLTCKYNKVAVLDNPFVIRFFRENKIVGLRGDYTKYDEVISRFLKSRKQYGIPYALVFSKKYPHGIVLPTVLKISDLINAINKAK